MVLSACNTGLGKDVKGEGLIGLTRAFMYAGANSVVASLWKVDDEATAELMRNFYRFMLKEDLAPAAALRKAQVAIAQQKRWQSPYYWAAFTIQGQYVKSTPPKTLGPRSPAWYAALAVALGLAGVLILMRKRRRAWQ